MKKLYLFVLLCMISVVSVNAQFRFGVEMGANMSTLTLESNSYGRNGFVGGVKAMYQFKQGWRLNSGLLFTAKGANGIENNLLGNSDGSHFDVKLYYLELPFTTSYRFVVASHINLVPEAGFFVAYGLGGNAGYRKSTGASGAYLLEEWNPFVDNKSGKLNAFDRLDGGLRFGLSAEVYKFDLSVHYDLGLCGVQSMLNSVDKRVSTRTTSITLGYSF